MKRFSTFLFEALSSEAQDWIESVVNTQKSLVKDNKLEPIEVDINKLNKPRKPFSYNDFFNNTSIKDLLINKNVGFLITNQIVRNPKNFIVDDTKDITINCYPYWYQDGNNIFFVGLCMYDKEHLFIDGLVNLTNIDSSNIVKNKDELNKAIFNDFIKIMSTDQKIKGIAAKPKHSKIKILFQKLGFNTSKDNNELMTYKIK